MTGFICNANYSLFPTVESQVPGASLALKTAISNSKKSIIWRAGGSLQAGDKHSCLLSGCFVFSKHLLKVLETMLAKSGVCNFLSALYLFQKNS